jgi:hypothetical protein
MPTKTSDTQDQATETPHYHRHRERLREDVQASAGEKDLQPLIAVIPAEIACPAEVDTCAM